MKNKRICVLITFIFITVSIRPALAATAKVAKGETSATVKYDAEAKSTPPNTSRITVTNNITRIADTVMVAGLEEGDIVKVYSSETGGKAIATAKVAKGETSTTVKIKQLGSAKGNAYVSVTSKGKLESDRITVKYDAEAKSTPPKTSRITVTNNTTGTADTVEATDIEEGDIVKVYSSETGGKAIGTAKAATGETSATVKIKQLGAAKGKAYVSVTSKGKLESNRTEAGYDEEEKSTPPNTSRITVTNNSVGTPDTVVVRGLEEGDIVKLYPSAKGGKAIGTAKVATDETSATVKIKQLGSAKGKAYVSLTSKGELESNRKEVEYAAEVKSKAPRTSRITATNNSVGTPDIVVVRGLEEGDIVKVYSSAKGGKAIGTAKVATDETSATVKIKQLGSAKGKAYVSLTIKGEIESDRTAVEYAAEVKSKTLNTSSITVTNNSVGTPDIVVVRGLEEEDIVKVYSSAKGGKAIGTAKVATDETSATVKIKQLGSAKGKAYISVTSKSKLESDRTEVKYAAEAKSTKPNGTIAVKNNKTGTADTVSVTGLAVGDIVKVYSSATGVKAIGTAKVATGQTSAIVKIKQLGSTVGDVYVSVTSKGKLESDRAAVVYAAEA